MFATDRKDELDKALWKLAVAGDAIAAQVNKPVLLNMKRRKLDLRRAQDARKRNGRWRL